MLLSPMEADMAGIDNETRLRQNAIALLLWIKKQNVKPFHFTQIPVNFHGYSEVLNSHPGLHNTQKISHNRFMAQLTDAGKTFLQEHTSDVQQVLKRLPQLR